MGISNPFNVDATNCTDSDLALLSARGGALIKSFCGLDEPAKDWDERALCVLKARKGFGKSHLLLLRSLNHRASDAANRTLFYPQGGRVSRPIDALGALHVVIPRWLQGREAVGAWTGIWQLAILGLLVWITRSEPKSLAGYSAWFGSLAQREGEHPPVMLTLFLAQVVQELDSEDFATGMSKLNQGLFDAEKYWGSAVRLSIEARNRSRIALYLDSPDELVGLDQPGVWRNIQQSLLLAIWIFSKKSEWSKMLNIYASVRSEAFGSGHDHPDVQMAMGFVIKLFYNRDELEAMLDDRIRQADPAMLALPLTESVKPVESLCGFSKVQHDERSMPEGGIYCEGIFDSILRHTRLVPREVIGISSSTLPARN